MNRQVLITGGAGFIGSHVAAGLIAQGDEVRLLDCLHPQVHGDWDHPSYLPEKAKLIVGDVRDRETVAAALAGVDTVVHLAARVGVGQSMYQVAEYSSVNTTGTAVLLESMASSSVRRLIVASSMSVYGEGLYVDRRGRLHDRVSRSLSQARAGQWDPSDGEGAPLTPLPTPETKAPSVRSAYAADKLYQEQMCLMFGETYQVETTVLRLFNTYGPHQALSNPYTGVLANFAVRLLNGRSPLAFEDGAQRRDFVHIDDAVRAFLLALEAPAASGRAVNVGSGRWVTVNDAAQLLANALGRPELGPEVSGKYRAGDIRHCFADISLAGQLFGYRPQVPLEDGVRALARWLEGQVATDRIDTMAAELASRGLSG